MIFSTRKLFRANRSHQRFHRDRFGRWMYAIKTFLKRLITKLFSVDNYQTSKIKGFTLIELLIAMLMATVIISTLLAFTVNIMETDRKEQAKVESQSDVQAALNYIADDMQEAVYIYDADSLNTNSPSGIKDQLPQASDNAIFSSTKSTPVLVFWKRKYYAPTDDVYVNTGKTITKKAGCLEYGTTTTNGTCDPNAPIGSGKYVYSLVAYYLIYDNPTGASSTWSNAARLGRWELNDGIRSSCQSSDITTCSEPKPYDRIDVTPPTAIAGSSMVNYWSVPDSGFAPFASTGGTVDALMNKWTKATSAYASTTPTVLIDFLDDSPYSADQDDGTLGSNTPAGNPAVVIPIQPNVAATPSSKNPNCYLENVGTGGSSDSASQRIPSAFQVGYPSSFYVCVNSTQNVARIYLRGNALARLRSGQIESLRRVFDSTYLSTGNIRALGRGRVYTQ